MGLFINSNAELRYDPREAAYRIHRDGEVSQPFRSQFEAKRAFEQRRVEWQ